MTAFLLLIIAFLSLFIVWLGIDYRRMKHQYGRNLKKMNRIIKVLAETGEQNSGRLKISDELQGKLWTARMEIDRELLDLQHDIIDTIAKKK